MHAITQVIEATMAARDPYTVAHQRRVTQLALSIAAQMNLAADSTEKLRIAGNLHDLGKVGVPSEILVHERGNGSGYPHGLAGPDIPLEARIIGVADVMEAMASDRPYRPALGLAKAMAELSQHKGVLYDPLVVDACSQLYRENKLTTFHT